MIRSLLISVFNKSSKLNLGKSEGHEMQKKVFTNWVTISDYVNYI